MNDANELNLPRSNAFKESILKFPWISLKLKNKALVSLAIMEEAERKQAQDNLNDKRCYK